MELISPTDIPQGDDYDEYRRMSRAIFDFRQMTSNKWIPEKN